MKPIRSTGAAISLAMALAIAISIGVSGCAGLGKPDNSQTLLLDASFKPLKEPISRAKLFEVTPAMSSWMDSHLGTAQRLESADGRARRYQRALIDALYDGRELRIDYDATVTRNAGDTFALRAGNCLSLVVMTAAFAKALDLEIQYRSVDVDETWSRINGMYFAIGHVNITLGKKRTTLIDDRHDYVPLTVDFFPPEATTGQRSWQITEETVVAMFMNNRAAEMLAAGDLDAAYWWAREAVQSDADFLAAYNTLGVIYRRHGQLDQAALAFEHVLKVEPFNSKALSNLATVLDAQGKTAEAAQMLARLDNLLRRGQQAPFAYFDAGIRHMQAGEFQLARAAFARELDRDPYNDEVNYWQARALVQLGDVKRADDHLNTAIEYSTTLQRREIYAAKRDYLKRRPRKAS